MAIHVIGPQYFCRIRGENRTEVACMRALVHVCVCVCMCVCLCVCVCAHVNVRVCVRM